MMATFLFEYLWPGSPGHLLREGSASAGGLFSEPGIPGVNTMNLWDCQEEPWDEIYTDVWKSKDGDEDRSDLCCNESKKAGKHPPQKGNGNGLNRLFLLFQP